jgi:hypothetical protein
MFVQTEEESKDMCSLNPVRCDFCENELDEKDSIGFSLH